MGLLCKCNLSHTSSQHTHQCLTHLQNWRRCLKGTAYMMKLQGRPWVNNISKPKSTPAYQSVQRTCSTGEGACLTLITWRGSWSTQCVSDSHHFQHLHYLHQIHLQHLKTCLAGTSCKKRLLKAGSVHNIYIHNEVEWTAHAWTTHLHHWRMCLAGIVCTMMLHKPRPIKLNRELDNQIPDLHLRTSWSRKRARLARHACCEACTIILQAISWCIWALGKRAQQHAQNFSWHTCRAWEGARLALFAT